MAQDQTLTMAELAARWKQSPRQVLERALRHALPVYFSFHGLMLDFSNRWLRAGGDVADQDACLQLQGDIEILGRQLTRSVLSRQGLLQLTTWETELTEAEITTARAALEHKKQTLAQLAAGLEQRDDQRLQCVRNGLLRAAPATLKALAARGSAPFPTFAYPPSQPDWLKPAHDGNGAALAGTILALEDGRHARAELELDDLRFAIADVAALDAAEGSATGHLPGAN